MKIILWIFMIGIVFIFILDKCSSEEELKPTFTKIPSDESMNDGINKAEKLVFDSLNTYYQSKGFKDICDLIASTDSVYKTADFMSGIVHGNDNFGEERLNLRRVIYDERIKNFYSRYDIDAKIFNSDQLTLNTLDHRLCSEYLRARHRRDDVIVTEDRGLQLYQETYIKYK